MEKSQKVTKELLETLDAIQIYGGTTEYGTDDTNQDCKVKCTQSNCSNDGCSNEKCSITQGLSCYPLNPSCNLKQFPQCGGTFLSAMCNL